MREALNHVVILLCLATLSAGHVYAGNWFYQTTIDSTIEGDDNKRLQINEEEGVVGAQVRSNLRLSRITETSQISLDGIWRSSRYDGEAENSNLDTDDQELRLNGVWNSERFRYSIDGSFLRQNSAITELEDTGIFQDIERRVTRSIRPQAAYFLFENTSLTGGVSYTDVEFPNAVPFSLTEFDVQGANLGITHNISVRTQISLTYDYSSFAGEDVGIIASENNIDTSNLRLRIDKSWTERLQTFVGIGFRKSNFSNEIGDVTTRNDDSGLLYEFGLTREFETFSINIFGSRQVEPSAFGVVFERSALGFRANKQLSQRLSVNLDLHWLENKTLGDDSNVPDRQFLSSSLGTRFRITDNWFITGNLRHRTQEFDDPRGTLDADSNAIIIGIQYDGNQESI